MNSSLKKLTLNISFEGSVNSLKFTNHGYEDLLVAISPDVPVKNAQLIIGDNLKISKILVHQLKLSVI